MLIAFSPPALLRFRSCPGMPWPMAYYLSCLRYLLWLAVMSASIAPITSSCRGKSPNKRSLSADACPHGKCSSKARFFAVLDDVKLCSEEKKGMITGESASVKLQSEQSEHFVYLRCLFHGGEHQTCVAQNNCQVLFTPDTCAKELKKLTDLYPTIAPGWSCPRKEAFSRNAP